MMENNQMKSQQIIFSNVKALHRLNFTEIIKIQDFDNDFALNEEYYDFDNYISPGTNKNGRFKSVVESCCDICRKGVLEKEDSWTRSDKDAYDRYYKDFKLKYVSHGSHSVDFLNAAGVNIVEECADWNDVPVLFLLENPSLNYEIYQECPNGKYPTNTWYWIHRRLEKPSNVHLDDYLVQGFYGRMVYALICEYCLLNAYMTNVVKCGLSGEYKDGKESYLGTSWYDRTCIKSCFENVLLKEIKCLTKGFDRLKIVAFGSNAYKLIENCLTERASDRSSIINEIKVQLVQLPHPSSRIKTLYRRYAVKGIMNDLLYNDSSFFLQINQI
ncbi:MAG: hypothetical protein J5874_03280 [Oscillospiraceae bacterium]|nr:hypothetical protein [Oscillospiraceae bacterium]